ncbi:hypothetical protein D4765_08710 [Subtercola vilae]|uniref:Uncharacterized protein n=1 Tax=Subtercola vilae TaxID=2056433 RepID=A0A4T2C3Z5_9MICO|nr:hypothetical protein D4765_08710 [Subtercola vilae]
MVTLVVVLIYVAGFVDIGLGLAAIFARYLPEVVAAGTTTRLIVTLVGAATVLFGLLSIALASGVSRGSRFARWGVSGLLLAGLLLTVVFAIAEPGDGFSGVVTQAVACAVVIAPLWLGRGGRYFVDA